MEMVDVVDFPLFFEVEADGVTVVAVVVDVDVLSLHAIFDLNLDFFFAVLSPIPVFPLVSISQKPLCRDDEKLVAQQRRA